MSDAIPVGKHERKVAFHAEAPFTKHDYRFRQRGDIRMAGSVWTESPRERGNRISRDYIKRLMRDKPIGLGFGTDDNFGPDENWHTRDELHYVPAREAIKYIRDQV